jgi:hypothetical protein
MEVVGEIWKDTNLDMLSGRANECVLWRYGPLQWKGIPSKTPHLYYLCMNTFQNAPVN